MFASFPASTTSSRKCRRESELLTSISALDSRLYIAVARMQVKHSCFACFSATSQLGPQDQFAISLPLPLPPSSLISLSTVVDMVSQFVEKEEECWWLQEK